MQRARAESCNMPASMEGAIMSNFILHVRDFGVEAMNALRPVAEVGVINFDLYTIRTDRTGAELSALIEPVLGPNPQYLLAGVESFAYRGDGRLSSAAQMLRDT
jgi:hypothetical protein